MAREIADEHYDREMVVPELSDLYDVARVELELLIAAKLEPVRKAMSGAGKIAQAFGPEGYACRAFIKDALALLEDEG